MYYYKKPKKRACQNCLNLDCAGTMKCFECLMDRHRPNFRENQSSKPINSRVNTCVCCGCIIPEGRQVCPNCEKKSGDTDV